MTMLGIRGASRDQWVKSLLSIADGCVSIPCTDPAFADFIGWIDSGPLRREAPIMRYDSEQSQN